MKERRNRRSRERVHASAYIPCRISPGKPRRSGPQAEEWILQVAAEIRSMLGDGPLQVYIAPYRVERHELLSCDVVNAQDRLYPLLFEVSGLPQLDLHSPQVPDALEAIHLCAALVLELDATVTLIP